MSGGSLDYLCYDVREAAEMMEVGPHAGWKDGVDADEVEWDSEAMIELFRDLADLLRAYEWWHSADTREEDYREAERAFLEKWPQFKDDS